MDWSTKTATLVRFCVQFVAAGVLKLNTVQCCQLLEESLIMAQYLDDKGAIVQIVRVSQELGLMAKQQGRFTDAVKFQQLSLRSSCAIQYKEGEMAAYCNLGNAYLFNKQIEDARLCYDKQKDIAIEIGDKKAEALYYFNIGGLHIYHLGQHDEALKCLQKSLALALKIRFVHCQKFAYQNMAVVYQAKNAIPEAIDCYLEYLKISPEDDQKKCKVYQDLGDSYMSLNSPDQAIRYFEKSLEVARKLDDKNMQKATYLNMAAPFNEMKRFPEAISCCLEYLKMAPEDDKGKWEVYMELGTAYHSLDEYSEAVKYFKKSREMARKLNDKDMEMRACNRLGESYLSQGNLQEALEYHNKVQELAVELGVQDSDATPYANLAAVHERLGNYSTAITNSQKALCVAVKTGDKVLEASVCGTLGYVCGDQGDYDKANEHHKRQLEICTEMKLKDRQIKACVGLGINYKNLGNYYETIKWHEMALELSIEIGGIEPEAGTYVNLGATHDLLGHYNEAIEYYQKSINIFKKINDRASEGIALMNLGNTNFKIGQLKKALECLEESLTIALEVDSKSGKVKAYSNLARFKNHFGQHDEALEFLEKQIHLSEEMGENGSICYGYSNKGLVYNQLGDFNEALFFYEKALELAQETGDKRIEAEIFSGIGRIHATQSRTSSGKDESEKFNKEAIQSLRNSLKCWEWIFEHIQEYDHFKVSILDEFINNYKLLSKCLIMDGKGNEAILVSERGKARALDDLLTSKYQVDTETQLVGTVLSIDDIEKLAINFSIVFHYDVQEYWLTWTISPDNINMRVDKIDFNEIVNRAYSTLQVRETTCENRLIQTEDHQDEPALTQRSSANDLLDNLLLAFKQQRCIPDEDLYDDDDYSNPLESLYNKLINPVLDQLTQDEVVIIPDGHLFSVPFAALQDPETGSYLSETKRIRLAPSLTSLKALMECPADFHSKSGALIIGNPNVGKVQFRGKIREIDDLPCAETEAVKIGELLGVQPFLGPQATKEAIKEQLKEGVAIIHFAAHGTRDGEILLTPPSTGSTPEEQDYILTMKEVQESGVRPQLVVLSCCHSGRGEVKAEGVVGMSRAFLAAGARAVVASLWAIADKATMVFMEKFYRHLKEGKSASTSLQQAMKDMRETVEYNKPMFWAPFFLIGDDVTVQI